MRAKLNTFLAIFMTALMLFEMVPGIAYAEAAETLSGAAQEYVQSLPPSTDAGGQDLASATTTTSADPTQESPMTTEKALDLFEHYFGGGGEDNTGQGSSSLIEGIGARLDSVASRPTSGISPMSLDVTSSSETPTTGDAGDQLAQAVSQRISAVNAVLADPQYANGGVPKEGDPIAVLTEGSVENGMRVIDVNLKAPEYTAFNMLSVPFLAELFNLEDLGGIGIGTAYENGAELKKEGSSTLDSPQFLLMLAVAFVGLGPEPLDNEGNPVAGAYINWDDADFGLGTFMTNYLFSYVSNLPVSVLSGREVPVILYSASDSSASARYLFRFHNDGVSPEWSAYRTITFDTMGGRPVNFMTAKPGQLLPRMTYNSSAGSYSDPTKAGYLFDGWYKDESYSDGQEFTFGTQTMPDSDFTLYAKWKPLAFHLGLYPEGIDVEEGVQNLDFTLDEMPELPGTTMTVEGKSFKGWKLDDSVADELPLAGISYDNPVIAPGGDYSQLAKLLADYVFLAMSVGVVSPDELEELVIPLVGVWDQQSVHITLDANGGTFKNEDESYIDRTIGSQYGELPTPERAGYDFDGWLDESRSHKVASGEAVTSESSTELKAQWKTHTYDITYLNDDENQLEETEGVGWGGDGTHPSNYTIESGEIAIANPTREGYDFTGWTVSGEGAEGVDPGTSVKIPAKHTGDLTLTAGWKRQSFAFVLDPASGTFEDVAAGEAWTQEGGKLSQTVQYGEHPTSLPQDPTRTGYDFKGWQVDGSGKAIPTSELANQQVTKATTCIAQWELHSYTVAYEPNDGSGHGTATMPANPTSYTLESGELAIPRPTRTGYDFAGWTVSGEGATGLGGGEGAKVKDVKIPTHHTGDITLTANWDAHEYKVTYAFNDASNNLKAAWPDGEAPQGTYTIENAFDVPQPTREGYTFKDWEASGSTSLGEGTNLKNGTVTAGTTGTLEFTACWTPITYNVTYELDRGSFAGGSAAPQTYDADTSFTMPTPTRAGHAFKGWEVSGCTHEGEGTDLAKGKITAGTTGALTFKAIWETDSHATFAVTWDPKEGKIPGISGAQEVEVYANQRFGEDGIAVPTPVREGWRFDGWKLKDAGDVEVGEDGLPQAMPDYDITFEATWTSYKALIEGIESYEGENLQTARSYYRNMTEEDRTAFDATAQGTQFKEAVLDDETAALASAIRGNAGAATTALGGIGTVSAGSADTTLTIDITEPATKVQELIQAGALSALLATDGVTATVGGQQVALTDAALVPALAWAGYASEGDYSEFTSDFTTAASVCAAAVLLGATPQLTITGATTAEGVTPQVTLTIAFTGAALPMGHANSATLTFDTGSAPATVDPITSRMGQKLTAPDDPSYTGHTFHGWYTDLGDEGSAFDFATDPMPLSDTTLHAKWEANRYTVTFDAGVDADADVQGTMQPRTYTYGVAEELPPCGFTRTGYRFAGWKANGTEDTYQDKATVESLTDQPNGQVKLVAQWEPVTSQVTLTFAEGEEPDDPQAFERPLTVTYDETYEACGLAEPTRRGYVFKGWFVANEDGTPSDAQIVPGATVDVTEDMTLVATWTPAGNVRYEVHYLFQNKVGDDYTENVVERKVYEGETGGTTGTEVTADQKYFDGFELDKEASDLSGTVEADGSLVLELKYNRRVWQVTLRVNDESFQADYQVGVRHGVQPRFPFHEEYWKNGTYQWDDVSGSHTITGWKLRNDGADGQTYTPDGLPEATGNATYVAEMTSEYEVRATDAQKTWATLELAMQYAPELVEHDESGAVTKGVTVSLLNDRTLQGNLTVPEGVMLLLPYTDGDTGYHPEQNNNQNIPGPPVNPHVGDKADADPHCTLTVPAGATLTVEGTVLVNALIGHKSGGYYVQDITGGWALLQADGTVVVGDGGTLDVHGYVRGSGTVTAKPGGTVGDLYVVQHWRGGSQALDVYYAGIYPMNETDCRHVEVPLTIESGGRLDGLVTMNASFGSPNAYFSTRFPQVDNANGLIRLKSGASATRTLVERDGETREHWEITGGADFSRSTLFIIQMDLSTGDYVFPIDGDTDWILNSGDYAFTEDFKFMPGALIEARDAYLTVAAGKTVVLYDSFDDSAFGATAYPKRTAATLSLDKDSTLTNYGAFAGDVHADAPTVREGRFDAEWEPTTLEAIGMSAGHTFTTELQKIIPHELKIECPDHEYEISDRGEVLWDGAESAFHPEEELAGAVRSAANKTAALEGLSAKATATDAGVDLAVDIQSAKRASGSAVSAVEDVVKALLEALGRDNDMVGTVSAGSGKDRYAVDLEDGFTGYDERELAKAMGLVAAAGGDGATGADLAGKSARLTVSGTGFHAGASVRLTIAFTCSFEPPVAPSSPTAAPDTSELEPEVASIVEASEPGREELNEGGGDEAAQVQVAATVTDDDAVTWTVTLGETAQEEPAADVAGSVIGSFLSSVAKKPEAVARISTVTGNPPEVKVELKDGRLPEDGLARILDKFGLAQGASAQAQALADGGSALIAAGPADGNAAQPFAFADTRTSAQALADTGAGAQALAADGAPAGAAEASLLGSLALTARQAGAAGSAAIPDGNAQVLAEDLADTSVSSDTAGDVLVGESYKLLAESPKGDTVTFTFAFRAASEATEPADPHEGLVAVYRLYNPADGQHLLTSDAHERDVLGALGWDKEGIASWQPEVDVPAAEALSTARAGKAQDLVFRMYNPSNGDHLYTMLATEVDGLEAVGWKFEGVAFASAEDAEGARPVWRLYNPNMTAHGGAGSHLYTANPHEYDVLGGLGWKQEGRYWSAAWVDD